MVSQLLPYPFMRLTELYGAGQGNFAPWDPVLYTNNYDWRRNPIMLTEFDGLGIVAGGLQIRSNYYGRLVARVEAFDDGGNSLGFFDANGVSNTAGDNSGLFIGVTGDSPIVSLAFSIISDNMLPGSYSVNIDLNSRQCQGQDRCPCLALLPALASAAHSGGGSRTDRLPVAQGVPGLDRTGPSR
jgi:hypothetical protein